jgi:N-acetylmuramoyl-L-alanine amidase
MRQTLLLLILITSLFSKNSIQSADWYENRLILTFEKSLSKKSVSNFDFYHKGTKKYKYIYDVKDGFIRSGHLKVDNRFVDNIIIGQNSAKKIRISFRNGNKLNFDYHIKDNQIIFDFKKAKQKAKKEYQSGKRTYLKTKNRKRVITIDAGHGGRDGGAVCKKSKTIEKEVVLDIAKYTKKYLEDMGYTVYLTREKDEFIRLKNRTAKANKKKSDIFISIHANSLPKKGKYRVVNGIETFFLSPARSARAKRVAAKENYRDFQQMSKVGKNNYLEFLNDERRVASHKLAIDVQNNILGNLRKHYKNVKDGGVQKGPFWVLVGAMMPSILVEVGYVTGDLDGKRLRWKNYKKRLAKGIAIGVKDYFKKN